MQARQRHGSCSQRGYTRDGQPQVEAILKPDSIPKEAVHELTEAARIPDVDIERGYWRKDGEPAAYQYKDPFGVLLKDSSGALVHSWWAMVDALRTA